MKTPAAGWKFPAPGFALLLAASLVRPSLRGQSAPASAPAPRPADSALPAGETLFPLPPLQPKPPPESPEPPPGSEANTVTVPIRPAAQYAVKRAQILLAEERRDPALLMGLFQDKEAQIRARTARALGRIGYPGSAEVLAILLADPAPEVQAGAAWGALYLGKEAKPLIADLQRVIAAGNAARLPALETLISLGDVDSATLVLQAIQNNPELRPQLAGHLFRIDTPAVRVMLKSWASNGRDLASQTGALASLVRLKADDEPMYRDILAQSSGEPAVWAVKGLGLAKSPAPETIAALETAAKREHDPMTRMEALGQIAKFDFSKARNLFKETNLKRSDIQTLTTIFDHAVNAPCKDKGIDSFSFINPTFDFDEPLGYVDGSTPNSTTKEYKVAMEIAAKKREEGYGFPDDTNIPVSILRRVIQRGVKCGQPENAFDFALQGGSISAGSKPIKQLGYTPARWRLRATFADSAAENKDSFLNALKKYSKESDSRIRASAAAALIQRGGSANLWLADKSAEVVANAADTASKIKPEEINPKRLSGAALMKAYQRFSLKKAEDGPNTRLYIVRAAAACAEKQPACLNVLKTALKDRVRTVQINAWERWPESLLKTRPEWPKPNLPRPDLLGAETRLQSLLANPPHFEVTTTKGKFTMLFTARGEAPLNVLNFRNLVSKRYFDGISWHRVVPNFVVQAGDPRGDGSGGPGWMIPCEYNSFPYQAGTVGMALDGKDSGGSQWFITLTAQPHLDYRYTVMGQVNSGLEVIYKLGEDDKIISIREIAYDPGATALPNPSAESAPPQNQ